MAKTMIEHLKERLKAQLTMRNKKPAPFAAEIELKADVIRDIFRKDAMPSAERLAIIADGLGVSIDYLLGRTDNPAPTSEAGPITEKKTIFAFLERIDGLSNNDRLIIYDTILKDIEFNTLRAHIQSDDLSEPESLRRVPSPSRRQ
jgi:transcriptional regulator with XRE-family HTH domain